MAADTVEVVVIEWIAHRDGSWEPSLVPQAVPRNVYDDLCGVKGEDGKMYYFLDKPKSARKAPAKKSGPSGKVTKETAAVE